MRACHGQKSQEQKSWPEGENAREREADSSFFCFRPFYPSPTPTLANTLRPLGSRSGKKFGQKLVTQLADRALDAVQRVARDTLFPSLLSYTYFPVSFFIRTEDHKWDRITDDPSLREIDIYTTIQFSADRIFNGKCSATCNLCYGMRS